MDYRKQYRKFLTSQYLAAGLRITAGAIIPSIILYHFGLLAEYIAFPLGALVISLTDNPGPPHHRRNGLIGCILLCFVVAVITGYSSSYPWLIGGEIVLFGMAFSMIAVYGQRISTIGVVALLVFIFSMDGHLAKNSVIEGALLFSGGGAWYAVLSVVLYRLRPYLLVQQMLGECIIETADYLRTKAAFYSGHPDYQAAISGLITHQVHIQQQHEQLREMMFKTRRLVRDTTVRGRTIMAVFLDSIDLFERIMTSQQDYRSLHEVFDRSDILQRCEQAILLLADELNDAGLAIQSGFALRREWNIEDRLDELEHAYRDLRGRDLAPANIEAFITLHHILSSIRDVADRIRRIHAAAAASRGMALKNTIPRENELLSFVAQSEINPRLVVDNFTLRSVNFRHSLRLTIALMTGYIISLLYPLGHAYWILLTIATIIKPAYGLSRQRNLSRIGGTLTGAVMGFCLLAVTHNHGVILGVMLLAMVVAYSFLKLQYFISSASITIYVLLSFFFLSPAGYHHALADRVIDTAIGSAIAFLSSLFILPAWEGGQMIGYMRDALEANKKYFDLVAGLFTGIARDRQGFKLTRKQAFVALANLSEAFQRLTSEPEHRRKKLPYYHQFVSTTHTLTAHIASLSYYAERLDKTYRSADFTELSRQVDRRFEEAEDLLDHKILQKKDEERRPALRLKVDRLLQLRKQEIEQGRKDEMTETRQALSELRAVIAQFDLIDSLVGEQLRILTDLADQS